MEDSAEPDTLLVGDEVDGRDDEVENVVNDWTFVLSWLLVIV